MVTGLFPLFLEFRIWYYERGLKSLQRRKPLHADIPDIVRHLHTLRAQRPRIATRPRSRCAQVPGLCAHDRNCEDRNCPGLHQRDGGHEYSHGIAWPIETNCGGTSS